MIATAIPTQIAGRVTEAEDTYKKASAMRPEDWQGYYRLGAFTINRTVSTMLQASFVG